MLASVAPTLGALPSGEKPSNGIATRQAPTKQALVQGFGFTEVVLTRGPERIHYYVYPGEAVSKTSLVLYIQGSDPSPQFSYRVVNGEVRPQCFIKPEHRSLPPEFLYVVVEKPGFEGVFDEEALVVPQAYKDVNSLDTSVSRIDAVLDHLGHQHAFERVVVYGHSEGAPIAAKLATVNSDITHFGFWAGNAMPDFFDFILEERIRVHRGETTDEKAQASIDEMIRGFRDVIAKDPEGTGGDSAYTHKRWWSFAEPPLYHLVELEIPVFVQVATRDRSVPIESSYLIPLEFARLGKDNLTYRVLVGGDHGFNVASDGGSRSEWGNVFQDFLGWVQDH